MITSRTLLGTAPAPVLPVESQRLLAGWHATGTPANYPQHLRRYGPLPLGAWSGRTGRARLIEEVEAAGLRGRGGAGFPTGRKLRAVADGRRAPLVLANGCEADPASNKDGVLLAVAPHLVLDGAVLAAHAVGATEVVVCVHHGARSAGALPATLAERRDPVRIRLVSVPGGFVASEASALARYLTTGAARPSTKPPHLAERGVRGRPTLVDNVETLAHLALLARYGAAWFTTAGTADTPGTLLVTIGGAVRYPGVYELPAGAPLDAALALAGGPAQVLQAILVGGSSGTWLSLPAGLRVPLSHEGMRAAGARMGVGVLLALPEETCGLAQTAYLLRYLAGQSAGQCGPCRFGLPAIATDLEQLVTRPTGPEVLTRLTRRLPLITGRGACGHPDAAVTLTTSALRVFHADLAAHQSGRPCPAAAAPPLFPVPGRS